MAVYAKSELSLVIFAAPANDNEKRRASPLFEKALGMTNGKTEFLIADSQYSEVIESKLRGTELELLFLFF